MRLPLASDLLSRDGDTNQDARLENVCVSVDGESIKRPGLLPGYDTPLGLSQGATMFKDRVWVVVDDELLGFDDNLDVDFSFDMDTLQSQIYSGAASYSTGDKVYAPDDTGKTVPWYPMAPGLVGVSPSLSGNLWSKTPPTATRYRLILNGPGVACLGNSTTDGFGTQIAAMQTFVNRLNASSACTGSGAYVYSCISATLITYSYMGGPTVPPYAPTGVTIQAY